MSKKTADRKMDYKPCLHFFYFNTKSPRAGVLSLMIVINSVLICMQNPQITCKACRLLQYLWENLHIFEETTSVRFKIPLIIRDL